MDGGTVSIRMLVPPPTSTATERVMFREERAKEVDVVDDAGRKTISSS